MTDVTGVAAKLYCTIKDCLKMFLSSEGVALHIEHLLRPLVIWNLCLPIWGGVISTMSIVELTPKVQGAYTSCLTFLPPGAPFQYENRQRVMSFIAKELVSRAKVVGVVS